MQKCLLNGHIPLTVSYLSIILHLDLHTSKPTFKNWALQKKNKVTRQKKNIKMYFQILFPSAHLFISSASVSAYILTINNPEGGKKNGYYEESSAVSCNLLRDMSVSP